MRKVYLFLAGSLLFSLPAVSQMQFQRHADDPRVIFHQNFEATEGLSDAESYRVWSTTPIDTILELEYYAKLGTSTPRNVDIYSEANAADWSIFAVRTDSVSSEHPETSSGVGIVIFNGVETSSSASEKANKVYDNDSYTIVNDGGTDADRNAAFANYGETGGKSYFKYTTGGIDASKISSSHYSTDTRSTKNYRRDLYVRGLDIEDESSYRLTFYIKTKKLNTWGPLFYADLMRGYHHQRAPFSMGYKSGKDFAFSMDEFEDGKWQKVTVMNYYLNDHEADGYVIYKGDYSWTDDWTWRPSDEQLAAINKTLAPGEVLNYVKQPDKYFVRFSFATDSIEYSLDNLTLTKSWIGGCEYNEDVLRINFGYQTNLDELVAEEKGRTNIPAVSIPNVNYKSFEVWYKKGEQMGLMPIRSAEYHDDGYMYMFTEYYPVDPTDPEGEKAPLKFGDYDSVWVTFHNPVDMPELTLKYNGSLYPKALDEDWVAAGKIVPDFYNEIATPNPNCNKIKQKVGNTTVIKNVVSIDGLPPIMNKAPYEDGAFGLDASTTTLKFKFQKQVQVDAVFNGEDTKDTKGVIAYVNNEVWEPSWDDAEKVLVITRPDTYTSKPLKGDYEIHLTQIKGVNGDDGNDVIMHYHFGDFSLNPSDGAELTHSDWRSTFTDPDNNGGCVAVNTWSHSYDSSAEQFEAGAGQEAKSTKNRVYILADAGLDNCGYYISPRNSKGNSKPKYSGNVYALVNISQAGDFTIKFKATNWQNAADKPNENVETHLYFYPKPELTGGASEYTFEIFSGVTGKIDLGSFEPSTNVLKDDIKDVSTGTWPVGAEIFEYPFTVSTPGDYIFEWCVFNPTTISSSSNGLMIGNYTIGKPSDSDLSTQYVKKLISAVAAAQSKVEASAAEMYKGADLNNLNKVVAESRNYKGNFPSQYDSVVANISAKVKALNLRIDTVDLFHSTEADVASLLASFVGDSAKYKALATYTALENHKNANAGWIDSVKATNDITAEIEAYKAEMNALDARMALIAAFNDKLKETKAIIDDPNARKDYDEYATMTTGYNTATAVDLISPVDSIITKATADLNAAKNVYLFRFDYAAAKTRQIKELYTLADALGYDFAGFGGNKDSIKNYVNALDDNDPELAEILRLASLLQITKAYAQKDETTLDKLAGLDVSALIPNYFLYNEAEIGRDMEKNSGKWRIKQAANTTALPGWTITPKLGNWVPTTVMVGDGDGYVDWEIDGHVFDGGLRCMPSTQGTLESVVEGLPQGYYYVGLKGYNQTSNVAFIITTDADTIGDGDASSLNKVFNGGSKFNFKSVGVDSVKVAGDMTLTINQTSSSSSEFYIRNFILRLTSVDDSYDYSADVTALQSELSQLITVVKAPAMAGSSVQYYNLGGMLIDAPKAGEIVIRKSVQNGKVVVDKVLIK